MADWLSRPWIEKAINSFYDKHASLPKLARAQIIQFNKIPSEDSASAEALLSDKWMYAKAILTPPAIEEFEKSPSNICEFSLCDIKGGLIFLNEYRVVPHVDYAKGVWEHLLIVNKFTFKGSEKSSQFGSELINSGAHSPFQVRIKKHFQLKQLVQLLQSNKNRRTLTLAENKAFDIKAITDSIIARHQFAFIPDEQQRLLDDIPEWKTNFCPPSTLDPSNSLNTSLPSNQEFQHDVSMSPHSNEADENDNDRQLPSSHQVSVSCSNSNDSGFNIKELPPDQVGFFGLYDNDGTFIKIPRESSFPFASIQKTPDCRSNASGLEESLSDSGGSKFSNLKAGLGSENDVKKIEGQDERIRGKDMDVDEENCSLLTGYLLSKRESSIETDQHENTTVSSESTPHPRQSPYATLLDILENLEQSDFGSSQSGNQQFVGDIVEEDEEVNDWTNATDKDKQIRRSSIESALAKQIKIRDQWLTRCSDVEVSFNESALSVKSSEGEEILQSRENYPYLQSNSQDKNEFSRFWVEFSQSQDLGRKVMTELPKNECMEDLVAGDKVEIVIEDAVECDKKGKVKKVVSISKEGSYPGIFFKDGYENEGKRIHENIQQKDDLVIQSCENEETKEQLPLAEDFASGSFGEYEKPNSSSEMTNNDAECLNESTSRNINLNDIRWLQREDNCSLPEFTDFDVIDEHDNRPFINSQLEDEPERIDAQGRTDPRWNQDQEKPWDMSRGEVLSQNMKEADTKLTNFEATFSVCEALQERIENLSGEQSLSQNVKETETKMEDFTAPSFASVQGRIAEEKDNSQMNKETVNCTCCCEGEVSAKVTTCQVCKERSLSSPAGSVQYSVSDGSSSSGQKSDESFSILKNASILDLTPGRFKPAYTSTAKLNEGTSTPTAEKQKITAVESEDELPGTHFTVKKKHVTFGKSVIYENKLDLPGPSFGSMQVSSSHHVVSSPNQSDPSDDDCLVPCTQQEDDGELMSLQDPLQILKSFTSTEDFSEKNTNFKAIVNRGNKRSRGGNYNGMQRLSDDDAPQCLNNAGVLERLSDAALRRRVDADAKALGQQTDAAIADDENDSQGSTLIGVGRELILCSDESEEFISSPITVARDTVIQCIKKGDTHKRNKDLVMGSEESPENIISSSPKTVAKENILQCIQQEGNSGTRTDVKRLYSQSKQISISDVYSARNTKGQKQILVTSREKPLSFSLSDSVLVNVFNASSCVAEKDNPSFSGLVSGNNPKEITMSRRSELNTFTAPGKKPKLDSIPCSSFYRFQSNLNSQKQTPKDFPSPEEDFENITSRPAAKSNEVDCMLYVPGKGLETSVVHVTVDSPDATDIPDKIVLENKTNKNNTTRKSKGSESPRISKKPTEFAQFVSAEIGNKKIWNGMENRNEPKKPLQGRITNISVTVETKQPIRFQHNTVYGNRIPDQLDETIGCNVDKGVAMETHALPTGRASNSISFKGHDGGLKRKRSREGDENSVVKKMAVAAPPASGPGPAKHLQVNIDEDHRENVMKDKTFGVGSSQAFTQLSCDHVMYSQQDPLVLEFSSSSENADTTSSQESHNQDIISPILLPSPPREIKTEVDPDLVDSCSQSFLNLKRDFALSCSHVMYSQQDPLVMDSPCNLSEYSQVYKSTNATSSRLKQCNKTIEESTSILEEFEPSSPNFVSLPSYQIPTTSNKQGLHPVPIKQEKKKTSLMDKCTFQGKNKPTIMSDSEEDESENNFCWFTNEPWKR